MTCQFPKSDEFVDVVANFAQSFPYIIFSNVREVRLPVGSLVDSPLSAYQILPQKFLWSIAEFLAFEGSDFAEAVTAALRGRAATESERLRFASEQRPGARLAFVLEMDHANRKGGSPIRVHGIERQRGIWRTERFFKRTGLRPLQRITGSLFRRDARRLQRKQMPQIALIQLVRLAIEHIDVQMKNSRQS
jgi:hypothetical protein